MTWGTGEWGVSPYGSGTAPPPTVLLVSSPLGLSPGGRPLVEIRGGTVIQIAGTDFFAPVTIEVLVNPSGPSAGFCEVFDYKFDLTRNMIFAGTPKLVAGTYAIRVTTDGGPSAILTNAMDAAPFAEEMKVQRVRRSYAPGWAVGPRVLVTNQPGD